MEQDRLAATSREEVSRMLEDHRKELLEKDRVIQHLWACNADLVATCGRSLFEVNSKCDSLISTLSKTVSQNVWFR